MSRHEKTIRRICAKPTPSDIRWDEMVAALESIGYVMSEGRGSHRKFYHAEVDDLIFCPKPHPSPVLDKGAVKEIARHLVGCGFFGEPS
ncbi:MAG: type II toxin-antitoxin system HicA family toxin [Zoogloeaceae bacterium]|nr:type II toxin-antitoxin system HicA family toxin [Zoogloeaceae bacterium]